MKKLFVIAASVILTAVISVYIFIPSQITVSSAGAVKTSIPAVNRTLLNLDALRKIWPGNILNDSVFVYDQSHFQFSAHTINNLESSVSSGDHRLQGSLFILPVRNDSVVLDWQYSFPTSINPFTRISAWFDSHSFNRQLDSIFSRIKSKLEDPLSLYGVPIRKEQVTDTLLISSKRIFDYYPSTKDAYQLIHQLTELINKQGVRASNPPMLHIQELGEDSYQVMVALPIKKLVTPDTNSSLKRMVMGNLLTAEIRGGPATIANTYRQMKQYISDYNMAQPAIPYEIAITNRETVTDTAQWVTKVCFPIY